MITILGFDSGMDVAKKMQQSLKTLNADCE
jgi:hypothetical protein